MCSTCRNVIRHPQESRLRLSGLLGSELFVGDFGCCLACAAVRSWSVLMFWSPGLVVFTEPGSPRGFCWFTGRGTRCGPGAVLRTRVDTGFWPLWVTRTLLGPDTCRTNTSHRCQTQRHASEWWVIHNSGLQHLRWPCTVSKYNAYRERIEIWKQTTL